MYRQIFNIFIMLLALISKPSFSESDVEKGIASYQKGDTKTALYWLESASNDLDAQLALARIYADIDLEKAEKWIEFALVGAKSDDNKNAEAHFVLGMIRGYQAQNAIFSKLSLAKKSKLAFEKAVELSPKNIEFLLGLMRFHVSAPSIAGGSIEEAKNIALKIKAEDPLQGLMAEIDIAREESDELAVGALIEKGRNEFADDAKFNYVAGMFFQQSENYEQAFEYFEKAQSDTNPTSAESRYLASYQYGRTSVLSESNIAKGISALNSYVANAPTSRDLIDKSWANFRLANLHEVEGDFEHAKRIYAKLKSTQDERLKKMVSEKLKALQ